jgi:hypothetical protein
MKNNTYRIIKIVGIFFACLTIIISCSHPSIGANKGDQGRIQSKAAEMQRLAPGWVGAGGDKEKLQALGQKMNRYFDKGDMDKGEAVLDQMLAILKGEQSFEDKMKASAPASTNPSPVAQRSLKGSKGWTLYEGNPIFKRTKAPSGGPTGVIWGDPSVMEVDGGYRMWLSAGTGRHGVKIYVAESTDGVNWRLLNGGKPVLQPTRGTFDAIGTETPAVVKAKGKYHMYYTSFRNKSSPMAVLGHAVSSDGIRWTKKGELTSITRNVGNRKGNKWGWVARGEPSIVYYKDTFYLYYLKPRCRRDDCESGYPKQHAGIGLATSKDGHNFVEPQETPVILQSKNRKASDGWFGHITSWALHDGKMFHVYVDACKMPPRDGRASGDSQPNVAIDHWVSEDGVNFKEVEINILTKGMQDWMSEAVWGPTVIHKKDGTRMMWFYATNSRGGMANKDLRVGIGLALYKP